MICLKREEQCRVMRGDGKIRKCVQGGVVVEGKKNRRFKKGAKKRSGSPSGEQRGNAPLALKESATTPRETAQSSRNPTTEKKQALSDRKRGEEEAKRRCGTKKKKNAVGGGRKNPFNSPQQKKKETWCR